MTAQIRLRPLALHKVRTYMIAQVKFRPQALHKVGTYSNARVEIMVSNST